MEKIILGIDPGTQIMGYGLIGCRNSAYRLIDVGVIKMPKSLEPMEKMQHIFRETSRLITTFSPTEAAIEAQFFGKNVQSMLKLGRAQGIAIAAALHHELQVYEYAPRKIKQSITGKGTASKEQVAAMLQRLLKFDEMPKHLDATDGLAVALCHYFQNGKPEMDGKKFGSWSSFLTANPDRVK
jgi:crossover junction endodeoxyribonuclease RuvC